MFATLFKKVTKLTENQLKQHTQKRLCSSKDGFGGGWDESVHLGKMLWSPKVGFFIDGGMSQPAKTLYATRNQFNLLEDKARRYAKYDQEKAVEYEHAMHHGQRPGDTWPFPSGPKAGKAGLFSFLIAFVTPAIVGANVIAFQQKKTG